MILYTITKDDGKYFYSDTEANTVAVIVNIARSHADGDFCATPNYPPLKFCLGQGKTPMDAFNDWRQRHCEYIKQIGRRN